MDQLREYLVVGGMPAAVAAFRASGSLRDAEAVLRSLHQMMQETGHPLAIRLANRSFGLERLEHGLPDGRRVAFSLLSLPLYLAGQARRLAVEALG